MLHTFRFRARLFDRSSRPVMPCSREGITAYRTLQKKNPSNQNRKVCCATGTPGEIPSRRELLLYKSLFSWTRFLQFEYWVQEHSPSLCHFLSWEYKHIIFQVSCLSRTLSVKYVVLISLKHLNMSKIDYIFQRTHIQYNRAILSINALDFNCFNFPEKTLKTIYYIWLLLTYCMTIIFKVCFIKPYIHHHVTLHEFEYTTL